MAIEIKELVIRMTVSDHSGQVKPTAPQLDKVEKSRLVQECVEKVLKKLRFKLER